MYKFSKTLQKISFLYLLLFPTLLDAQTPSIWSQPIGKCWSYQTANLTSFGVASDNDKIILVPFSNGLINALDYQTGTLLWSLKLNGELASSLFIKKDTLYFIDQTLVSNQISLVSVDIKSGIINWRKKYTGKKFTNRIQIASNSRNLFLTDNNGNVGALHASKEPAIWTKKLESKITSNLLVNGKNLLLGTSKNRAVLLSQKNGDVVAQIPIKENPSNLSLATNKRLLIGDVRGNVQSYDLVKQKQKWFIKTGGKITEMTPLGKNLLVSSDDNFVYSVSLNSGKKRWKRKLSGRIIGKAMLDEEVGVFLSHGSNIAIFVNLRNGKIVNRLTVGNADYFVGAPIFVSNKLALPTNKGLIVYGPNLCKSQEIN